MFDLHDTIWTLDIESYKVRQVADANAYYRRLGDPAWYFLGPRFGYDFYADVSPDGSRIVYATCEYMRNEPVAVDEYGYTAVSQGYEIVMVNIDGSNKRRLTWTRHYDNYPAWSPDGEEIAFVTRVGEQPETDYSHYAEGAFYLRQMKMAAMSVDADSGESGEVRLIYPLFRPAPYPAVWSPDGQRLALVANDKDRFPRVQIIYTLQGSPVHYRRIGETAALPAWSPDSDRLAYAAVDEDESVIYTVNADGTNLRRIWSSGPVDSPPPVSQVLWSPDGSEILFVSGGVHILGIDGSGLRTLVDDALESTRAAWSPDGSRIAVHHPVSQIVTMARDGSERRVEMDVHVGGVPRPLAPSVVEACSGGVVVPEPESNRSLVEDCKTLLGIWNAYEGFRGLPWSTSIPMSEWPGVVVDERGSYVIELQLEGMGLSGPMPQELGNFPNLQVLNLASNPLTGEIPEALGGHTDESRKLRSLNLERINLSGPIPPELGNLSYLEELSLAHTDVSGPIPPSWDTLASCGG